MTKFTRKLFEIEDVTDALAALNEKGYQLNVDENDIAVSNTEADAELLTRKVVLSAVTRLTKQREFYVAEAMRNQMRRLMNTSSRK